MARTSKTALIFGVTGQDGSYLLRFLLSKGYEVHGTSRDSELSSFANLRALGIRESVIAHSVIPSDFRGVVQCIREVNPSEIYDLSGQTSVGLSFSQPIETFESIAVTTLNILESMRFLGLGARFYNACSGECFGGTISPANEKTPFSPKSPYAAAKAASFWQVANYREAYGLFACSGILFNHESPLRPSRFVTRKIISAAARIASGSGEILHLGDLSIYRDWGWAPEYVEAMWLMLQQASPGDFVISTGELNSLEDFVSRAFGFFRLDWRQHVRISQDLFRPAEVKSSWGDPSRAARELGWAANMRMNDVVAAMARAEAGKGFSEDD